MFSGVPGSLHAWDEIEVRSEEDREERSDELNYAIWFTPLLVFAISTFNSTRFARRRSRIAKLTDKDLSRFLTNDVVMGGVIIGLGQLTFLMFASIQCDNGNFIDEVDDWRQCNRTLYSSAGETKYRRSEYDI